MPFHGKEMQINNKNNRKVTKLPTAKLIEIAVANCKKLSQFRDRIDVLCTKALPIFPDWKLYIQNRQIGNLLARFSYESRYPQSKAKENFCDFR